MKRKVAGTAMVLLGLICLMGADTIGWGPGEPIANPGGLAKTIEGKGPYTVDALNTFVEVDFFFTAPNQVKANANNGTWDKTVTLGVAGNYDCWAELTPFTTGTKTINVTKTTVVKLAVK